MKIAKTVKLRATKLRGVMNELGHSLNHSESLEAVSRLEGYTDWNTYSASLKKSELLHPLPTGWIATGDNLNQYELGCDPGQPYNSVPAATIRSKDQGTFTDQTMSTVMQKIRADNYLRSNIKLSAKLKAVNVVGAVTIWLRIDGINGDLVFDNLEESKILGTLDGTTDWEERSIVLSVPIEAVSINFGFYLRGTGVAHAADFSLVKVDDDTKVSSDRSSLPAAPKNLDFQHSSN